MGAEGCSWERSGAGEREAPGSSRGVIVEESRGISPSLSLSLPQAPSIVPGFALEKVRTGRGLGDLIVPGAFRIQEGRDYFPRKSLERAARPGLGGEGLAPEH